MRRLQGRELRRLGLQLGLLAGIGSAFLIGSNERTAVADGGGCVNEESCTYRRPNVMFVVDYSTSMNQVWDVQNDLTRWEVTVATIQQITAPGTWLDYNTHLALLRFGHDPIPASPGTPIAGDSSGIVDGQALDIAWDDANNDYVTCGGGALVESLAATPAPQDGALVGIQSWTKGALDRAAVEIAQTKADHPQDGDERPYAIVLVTDGVWTSPDGTMLQSPPSANPTSTAQNLYDNQSVRTYVVVVGGNAQAEAAGDELAAAGGTTQAVDSDAPGQLADALDGVTTNITDEFVTPQCVGELPRVMILLDASSSMLNINGGTQAGSMGETGWDQAREVIAGFTSVFDVDVGIGAFEDAAHVGLAVFGHGTPAPGEQKILVQYGPCLRDNFAWALDPETSCEQPGCVDPWGGPPITWTFKDGVLEDPPGFTHPTQSHMPRCDGANSFCAGSGTYTHLGLELIKNNQVDYHLAGLDPMAQHPTSDATSYVNILITDGQYNGYSTNAQVQTELEAMYNAGITTYVVGFGDGVNTPQAIAQLESMADWGSGGALDYYDANNQFELEQSLQTIVGTITGNVVYDPCCVLDDCSEPFDPTSGENGRDPVPNPTTGDGDGDGDPTTTGDGDGDPTTTGDGDGDPSGDGDPATGDGDGDPTGDATGGDESGTSTGDDATVVDGDDGCNCRTADGDERRWLFGLLGLSLLGFVRRRPRASE